MEGSEIGDELILLFSAGAAVNFPDNGTAANIRLASLFNGQESSVLTLIFDGEKWLEKSRSVNA
jgi:hypothetical protein